MLPNSNLIILLLGCCDCITFVSVNVVLKPSGKSRGTINSPTIRVNVSVKRQATMKDIGPHIIVSLLFTIKFQIIGGPKPRNQRHRFLHTELIAENFKILQDKYTTRMEDQ